ncbi:preprotein translocase subunit SecD [Bradyrhizobium sp. dw_411]|uniref:SecDF P1 head subdomain-containing protein n=1 Tax=Bradyrhizobium sp. dw_411 TaxID=2720082 RepID=UPI001BCD71AC|nr:preprotein translocase subunit SecD [Bradyrhizobium sp. dw_411]
MNQRARTTGLTVAFILAFAFPVAAAPAPDAAQMRAKISAYVENALATQGGSRIVFKVDSDALREAIVMDLRDEVFQIVHDGRIPFAGLALRDGGVEVRIANANDRQKVASKLVPATQAPPSTQATPTVTVADSGDGLMRFMPTDSRFNGRLNELLQQSIEMIAQRLRDSGIKLADAQPDGADRIRVLLPGIRDPERVTAIFSKRAHVAFRLVDESMTSAEALKGAPPPASEILYHFKSNEPYLVLKEIAMGGDDIIDVSPGFDQRSDQPIATFRFNGRGTKRFAHITEENIGKPFAVVADDKVLSVPVIREPIRGGTGQIAGNFTLEEANRVAMLLRSGTLPGRLSVVDQQMVEPDVNAKK